MNNIGNHLFDNMFDTKPTTRQIVEKLALFNPSLWMMIDNFVISLTK